MADNHSREVRSYNMSRIQSKNTKPEDVVCKYLFSHGLRYRKNDNRYPGKPDIVLPKYHTIVFVHGCFWHGHEDCPDYITPKSNTDYWVPKLNRNKQRDQKNITELKACGWNVIIVWECELKMAIRKKRLERLIAEIKEKTL